MQINKVLDFLGSGVLGTVYLSHFGKAWQLSKLSPKLSDAVRVERLVMHFLGTPHAHNILDTNPILREAMQHHHPPC